MTKLKPGFMLTDAGLAFILAGVFSTILAGVWFFTSDTMKNRMVAAHFNTVLKAAERYIQDASRYNALLTAVGTPTSKGKELTIKNLKDTDCLAKSVSEENGWGQKYKIFARKTQEGNLSVFVYTTGGRGGGTSNKAKDIEFEQKTTAAAAAIAKVGWRPRKDNLYKDADKYIYGPYGSWKLKYTPGAENGQQGMDFAGAITPGHLAMESSFDVSDLKQDYLYREGIPGHEELNQMQVDLDMGGKDIKNLNSILDMRSIEKVDFIRYTDQSASSATSSTQGTCNYPNAGRTFVDYDKGLYVCRLVGSSYRWTQISDMGNSVTMKNATILSDGDSVPGNTCPGGFTSHVYVTPVFAAGLGKGTEDGKIYDKAEPMHSFQTLVKNGKVEIWVKASKSWVRSTSAYGRKQNKAAVFTTCEAQ